jgi:multiple sugar transport system permease protein
MTAERARRKASRRIVRYLGYSVLLVFGAVMFVPFWWTIATSLGPADHAFSGAPVWFPWPVTFENYSTVLQMIPIVRQFFNSVLVTGIIVVGSLTVSLLAAYAFARLRFPGRGGMFITLLAGLMVPGTVTLIPVYIVMRNLGLLDTLTSLWLPALIQVFSIFMLRQRFAAMPPDLDEAAQLDGAGRLRILFRIYLPVSWPIVSALAIFVASNYWNDFLGPNIFLSSPQNMTLPVGMVALQNQYGSSPAVVVFAGIAMILVPLLVLFLFTQRKLTEAVSMTGVSR